MDQLDWTVCTAEMLHAPHNQTHDCKTRQSIAIPQLQQNYDFSPKTLHIDNGVKRNRFKKKFKMIGKAKLVEKQLV